MAILESISKCVNWYQNNYSKATPDQLLDIKDKMVTLNYNLAEELAYFKKEYNLKHFDRRIQISRQKNELINGGKSATAAESMATEQSAEVYKSELENESAAVRLDLLLRQSNKIVESITQRLAVIRDEMKQNN